jgi:tRNA(adenine34) deaminase
MDDQYFMKKALDEAQKALSKGEFPVGCILVYENEILVRASRVGTSSDTINEIDHAELLALRQMADLGKSINPQKTTLFCTMEPCLMCFGAILLSGIHKIVYAYEDVMGGGTPCNLTRLKPLYKDSRISIIPHVLRQESLALFKTYFSNPATTYWKKSLLETYTLDQ